MARTLSTLADLPRLGFDSLIDARSPAEYAEDHLPGAINLPVLSDEERARVGTIYKQQSPFLARKIGGAMVARNVAAHLDGPLADKGGGWRPLVYCWRGGQRSQSFATILTQVGWRAEVIEGGYKTWRRLVVEALGGPPPVPLRIIDGNTGSAKTALLAALADRGAQVIDLEGLANHRGSLFGHMPGGQPGQKAFEGRLATALSALDPARPVYVEAESSRIGNLSLPKGIWAAMGAAPRLRIAAPRPARAAYLAEAYGDLTDDPARLTSIVESLRPLQPSERIDDWLALAAEGRFTALAEALMEHHYDPRYNRHRDRFDGLVTEVLETENLRPEDIAALADRIHGHQN